MTTQLNFLHQARNNLDHFISSCPKTEVQILYFSRPQNGEILPRTTYHLREWNPTPDKTYLLSQGLTTGWCYVYNRTDIEYLVRIQGDHIKEFIWGDIYEDTLVPNEEENINTSFVSHGDHITIGINISQNQLIMKTHLTTYDEIFVNTIVYNRNEHICNINLANYQKGLTKTSVCEPPKISGNKNVNIQLQTVYNHYNQNNDIFNMLKFFSQIYLGITPQYGGQNKNKKIYHKGQHYIIKNGIRGGKYIIDKNGYKKYIKEIKYKGGTYPILYKGEGFTEPFIDFLYVHVLQPTMNLRPDLEMITMIYDKTSLLGHNTHRHIVLLYDFVNDTRHKYYIDVEKTLIAHYVALYPEKATNEEKTIFETFKTSVSNFAIQVV